MLCKLLPILVHSRQNEPNIQTAPLKQSPSDHPVHLACRAWLHQMPLHLTPHPDYHHCAGGAGGGLLLGGTTTPGGGVPGVPGVPG